MPGMSSASKLTIHIRIPQQGNARPSVKFLKRDAFTDDELAVFSSALRAANKVTAFAAGGAPAPPVSPCQAIACHSLCARLLSVFLH